MNQPNNPKIISVGFHYNGTLKNYEMFALNIIKDYIVENRLLPDSAFKAEPEGEA